MRVKAVYTVEASMVMAVCIGIVMASILLTFHIYRETVTELVSTAKSVDDAATRFRQIQFGKEVLDTITSKEK
ncbi:MAG: hypothetical protein II545_03470 [Lachnospiraceae bacterium]|nr:hypothetical protein [Lachnospiraceae bacterium]